MEMNDNYRLKGTVSSKVQPNCVRMISELMKKKLSGMLSGSREESIEDGYSKGRKEDNRYSGGTSLGDVHRNMSIREDWQVLGQEGGRDGVH